MKSHPNYIRKAQKKTEEKVLLEVLEIIHGSTLAVFCRGFLLTLAMRLSRHVKDDGNRYTSEGWVAGWLCNYPLPRYMYSIVQFTPLHRGQQHKTDQLYLSANEEEFSLEKIKKRDKDCHIKHSVFHSSLEKTPCFFHYIDMNSQFCLIFSTCNRAM